MRILLALASLVLLAGCGIHGSPGASLVGDGQVLEYKTNRGAPVQLTGTTLDGKKLSLDSTRGKVTVINVWWSGCVPCATEMPMLQKVHQELGSKVAFVGINIRDSSAANGLAFQRGRGVTYPSIYSPDGSAVLVFASKVSPQTIPATIVLDPKGRVFAVIRGAIQGNSTLGDVVEDAQAA